MREHLDRCSRMLGRPQCTRPGGTRARRRERRRRLRSPQLNNSVLRRSDIRRRRKVRMRLLLAAASALVVADTSWWLLRPSALLKPVALVRQATRVTAEATSGGCQTARARGAADVSSAAATRYGGGRSSGARRLVLACSTGVQAHSFSPFCLVSEPADPRGGHFLSKNHKPTRQRRSAFPNPSVIVCARHLATRRHHSYSCRTFPCVGAGT